MGESRAFEILRRVPLFADLGAADLERLCQLLEPVELDRGDLLFCEGDPGDKLYVIKAGEIEIFKLSGGREVLVAVRGAGEVIGEMAVLEDQPRSAGARARGPTSVLAIDKATIDQLISTSTTAARAMFYTAVSRYRQTNTALMQSEKMAQLGTLSAGIAHELNNPAAAVRRGAGQLETALDAFARASSAVGHVPPALEAVALHAAAHRLTLDPVARSDREAEIEVWLTQRGIAEPWELAPTLAELDLDLDQLPTETDPGVALRWLATAVQVRTLVAEIGAAASRLSEIAQSMKSYVYLDQAPSQQVDVHAGLDVTLVILSHKLKGVTVVRQYDPALPRILAWGSELNQVFTNLLDNAADALGGKGTITIRTFRREPDWVGIEIEDDGPGIPEAIRHRVFDPFFTTKPPGQGTGLGLEITQKIVRNRHRGDIEVRSRPGSTVFTVLLPIDPEHNATPAPLVQRRASDERLREILTTTRTIAVVGLRDEPDVPARNVPAYLQQEGYRIIPVNPRLSVALGEKAWPDLRSVPEPVDLVLVFRRVEVVPEIVRDAVAIGAKTVWMQEGIRDDASAAVAEASGLNVVMDTCMRSAHRRLLGRRDQPSS